MCGIFGIVSPYLDEINPELIARIKQSIHHRGPDHSDHHIEPGLVIGSNRLAIVDLEAGNQPIYNNDRSLVIAYNGEIYNHLELRSELIAKGHVFYSRSDTETVLHAFEEYGSACVKRLNGMFAFAIWNSRDKSLFLARDRLGIKPLYISRLDSGLVFASEAKAILPLFPSNPQPDWSVLNQFFSYGYIPSPASAYAGINKLSPSHYAWFRNGEFDSTRYWSPEYGLGESKTLEEDCGKLLSLIDQSVNLELMGDVPVGVFLSGGLDSSAVALFAKKNSKSNVKSFSLKFEETTHDESADARLVSDHLKLEHHECLLTTELLLEALPKVVRNLDEPFGDSTVLPLFVLSEFARKNVKVVLTGWGGDEIFAGYPTYKAHIISKWFRKLPKLLSSNLIPSLVELLPISDKYMSFEFKAKRFIRGMDVSPELQHFLWMEYLNDQQKRRLFTRETFDQIQGDTLLPVREVLPHLLEKDIISRVMHLDSLFFLEGNGLFQADRMTMAASLEARVPLLNNNLTDFVNSLPVAIKMQGRKPKELLRKVLQPYFPNRILNKPKKGFGPPSSAWVRGVFSQTIDQLFSREKVNDEKIFNYEEIRKLINEHKNKKMDHGRNLWALFSFQLWYDNFISGSSFHKHSGPN
jgi:asparagine synthase (glutamine-hydrolysing)